jgi:hypothetical protein
MLQPINGYTLIKQIDNTQLKSPFELAYHEGTTDISRLTCPNQGRVIASDIYNQGDILHYINTNCYRLEQDTKLIYNDNIML